MRELNTPKNRRVLSEARVRAAHYKAAREYELETACQIIEEIYEGLSEELEENPNE